jgi:hypothetical protein
MDNKNSSILATEKWVFAISLILPILIYLVFLSISENKKLN